MKQAEADVEPALPGLCWLFQDETWQDEAPLKPAEQGVLPSDESPRKHRHAREHTCMQAWICSAQNMQDRAA